jgi:hypothetical protein
MSKSIKPYGFRALSMSDNCDENIVPCTATFSMEADILVAEDRCNDESSLISTLRGWTITATQQDYSLAQINLMFGGTLAPAVVSYGQTLRMGGELILPSFNIIGQILSSDGLSTLLFKLYRVKVTTYRVSAAQDDFMSIEWTGKVTELLQTGTVSLSQEVYTRLVPVFPDLSCATPWLLNNAIDELDITQNWQTANGDFWELA